MDGDGPDDGNKHEGDIEPRRRFASAVTRVEQVAADVQVEQQISVEHQHVPTEHGCRELELADAWDQVPEMVRPSQVHSHER